MRTWNREELEFHNHKSHPHSSSSKRKQRTYDQFKITSKSMMRPSKIDTHYLSSVNYWINSRTLKCLRKWTLGRDIIILEYEKETNGRPLLKLQEDCSNHWLCSLDCATHQALSKHLWIIYSLRPNTERIS